MEAGTKLKTYYTIPEILEIRPAFGADLEEVKREMISLSVFLMVVVKCEYEKLILTVYPDTLINDVRIKKKP